jgi:hypothetical protein
MVEEKTRCCVSGIIESGHGFSPFGKVIDCHENVLVPLLDGGLQVMKSMPHLQEGVGGDDWM